jgi:hypothetical protein
MVLVLDASVDLTDPSAEFVRASFEYERSQDFRQNSDTNSDYRALLGS